MAPIFLALNDIATTDVNSGESRQYQFYIGVVPKEIPINVKNFELSDLKYYGAILATLIVSLLLSTYCVF